jgi:ankyrin repeat protein
VDVTDNGEADGRGLALCAAHGLRYDPVQHSGCVVCRRADEEPSPTPRRGRTHTTLLASALAGAIALALLHEVAANAQQLLELARVFTGQQAPRPTAPARTSNNVMPAPSAAPSPEAAPAKPAQAAEAEEPSPCTLSAQGADAMREVAEPAASAIVRAAARGDAAKVAQELELGARADERDASGRTALAWAAATAHAEAARVLLDAHANPNLASNEDVTPLMLAASVGSAPLVELLLASGARLDAADQHARTALMLAARANRAQVVSVLLGHKAALEARCERGMTALHHAAEATECIDALVRLIAARPNVDAPDMRGVTALMLAAHAGHVDAVSALLDAGARVDLRDNQGLSALDYVVTPRDGVNEKLHRDLFEVLQLLIDRDPDAHLGLDPSQTPVLFRAQLDAWARGRGRPPLAAYAPSAAHAPADARPNDAHGAVLLLRALGFQSSRSYAAWPYQEVDFTIHGLFARVPNVVQQVRISGLALRSGQQVTLSGDAAGKEPWEVDDVVLIERYQGYERRDSAFAGRADAMRIAEQPVQRLGSVGARFARGAIDFSPWFATGSGADHVLVSLVDFGASAGCSDIFLHVMGPHAASTAQGLRIEPVHPN